MGTATLRIPDRIKKHLAAHPGRYTIRSYPTGDSLQQTLRAARVPLECLAVAVPVKVGASRLLVVHGADRTLDLEGLARHLKRRFELCSPAEAQAVFADCHPSSLPPFGMAYGIKTLLDSALEAVAEVFFSVGAPGYLVRAAQPDFKRLMDGALRGPLARPPAAAGKHPDPHERFRQRIEQVGQLPTMPGMAHEIIRLRDNPYTHASELAAVIEQDPSLSAQLLHYARSPLYGYPGRLETIEQAIVQVLGMDFVMDMAFGLALGRSFRNPRGGALGLDAFWRHAIYSASLAQALCMKMEYSRRPAPGVAYLTGLLHNFGFLLLGHLFPLHFERLNRALGQRDGTRLSEIERDILGVSHTHAGGWLMRAWELPPEIVEVVERHHEERTDGDYAVYVRLVRLANRLLKRLGIGDEDVMDVPDSLLRALGLEETQAEAALGAVLDSRHGLDFMARKMVA